VHLASAGGSAGGALFVTAGGQLWASFPDPAPSAAGPGRSGGQERKDPGAPGGEGPLVRARTWAAALHAQHPSQSAAPSGRVKAEPSREPAGESKAPAATPDRVPKARKRAREESQVDAAPIPASASSLLPASSQASGAGSDPDGPRAKQQRTDSLGDLHLSLSQGTLDAAAARARDQEDQLRRLEALGDRVAAEGWMDLTQAGKLVAWFKDCWDDVDPTSEDLTALARATGLSREDVGRFISTIRFRFSHIPVANEGDPTRDCEAFRLSQEEPLPDLEDENL
jgi:hypothetical protein